MGVGQFVLSKTTVSPPFSPGMIQQMPESFHLIPPAQNLKNGPIGCSEMIPTRVA